MLTAPLEQAAGQGSVPEEIRRHVKAMSTDARLEFIEEAIAREDFKTLSSVLGAPHYLSGMTPTLQAELTRQYHQKRNPEIASRLRVMKAAQAMLQERGPLLFAEIEKGIGADWRKVKRLQEARDASNAAFVVKQQES